MPIFEYECPNGHRQEKLCRSFDTRPATAPCLECAEPAVVVPSASVFGGFREMKESNVGRAIRRVKARGL